MVWKFGKLMNSKTISPRGASFGVVAVLVAFCILLSPLTALARKGEKNFKRGLDYERAQQWELAAQEFALAIAALPSDTEYQLHYRRALFNASQVYMQQGNALAEKGDYQGAYNAFRQAYGYDPINQIAVNEMERMLRLQREKEEAANAAARPASVKLSNAPPTSRAEQLRVINYSGDLKAFIKQLADELGINVIFDYQFQTRNVTINLRDVTTAQALDYIFATQNLFFQRLGRRTILVADQTKRLIYQQLVARTFYVINIDAEDARAAIQNAFPAGAGRTGQIYVNKKNNTLIVRDTPENVAIIGEFLKTVDKDRAEVVMDVEVYEINQNDLLQIGNQIDPNALANLGGYGFGTPGTALSIGHGLHNNGNTVYPVAPATGATFIIPPTTLSFLQGRGRTRLLDRTQVHAFEGEATNINIGQKVPVQTASVPTYTTTTPTGPGVTPGIYGNGYPVIQYQDTGLTLKFTPTVFPNQDVQVKLEITSSIPQAVAGGSALTPAFNQRTLNGTARIPNNRTLMIASVSQDTKQTSVQGLPVLGLIPIFGRLFATPNDTRLQTDIVIIVTPRVLRGPSITPEDERTFPTGTAQYSASESIESLIAQVDREDQEKGRATAKNDNANDVKNDAAVDVTKPVVLASASVAASASPLVKVEGEEPPAYIPAPKILAGANDVNGAAKNKTDGANAVAVVNRANVAPTNADAKPSVKAAGNADDSTANNSQTKDSAASAAKASSSAIAATTNSPTAKAGKANSAAANAAKNVSAATNDAATNAADLRLLAARGAMRVGEKQRLLLTLATNTPLGMVAGVLRFDPKLFAVRVVSAGTIFGSNATAPSLSKDAATNANSAANITQMNDPAGGVMLMISPATGAGVMSGAGTLVEIEIEALAKGAGEIVFDRDTLRLIATNGQSVRLTQSGAVKITVE
jgi:general secretion pathway protein D